MSYVVQYVYRSLIAGGRATLLRPVRPLVVSLVRLTPNRGIATILLKFAPGLLVAGVTSFSAVR